MSDSEPPFHSRNLRKHRRTNNGGTFMVTKCLRVRRPVLLPDFADQFSEALRYRSTNGELFVAAFVVMPDHWHAVLSPGLEADLSSRINLLMRWLGRQVQTAEPWQSGFHEMRIRSRRQFHYCVDYVEYNPVRKNLVINRDQWPWSSANPIHKNTLMVPWPWRFEHDE